LRGRAPRLRPERTIGHAGCAEAQAHDSRAARHRKSVANWRRRDQPQACHGVTCTVAVAVAVACHGIACACTVAFTFTFTACACARDGLNVTPLIKRL
jgi:hypothetical protein